MFNSPSSSSSFSKSVTRIRQKRGSPQLLFIIGPGQFLQVYIHYTNYNQYMTYDKDLGAYRVGGGGHGVRVLVLVLVFLTAFTQNLVPRKNHMGNCSRRVSLTVSRIFSINQRRQCERSFRCYKPKLKNFYGPERARSPMILNYKTPKKTKKADFFNIHQIKKQHMNHHEKMIF